MDSRSFFSDFRAFFVSSNTWFQCRLVGDLTRAAIYQCINCCARLRSARRMLMRKTILLVIALACLSPFFLGETRAQPQCDDGYALCMTNCATDGAPERCMQRCQEAERRCSKSGVFRMPIGFLFNKARIQDFSRAEGELPPGLHRTDGSPAQVKPPYRKDPAKSSGPRGEISGSSWR